MSESTVLKAIFMQPSHLVVLMVREERKHFINILNFGMFLNILNT